MLIEHEGVGPRVAESAYVAPNAVLCGDVRVGEEAGILFGELFSPDRHEELWTVQERMDFPGTVFGMSREEATMERVTRRYSKSFGRHRGDRVLRTLEP